MRLRIAVLVLGIGIAAVAQAQGASASATASAKVIASLTITKTQDLNFGALTSGASAGTAVIDGTTGSRTTTGGITAVIGAPNPVPAQFTVTGEPTKTYTIALPSSAVTITSGANSMTVDTFTSDTASPATLPVGGSMPIQVGATLHAAANQAPGTYSGNFTVTVLYN